MKPPTTLRDLFDRALATMDSRKEHTAIRGAIEMQSKHAAMVSAWLATGLPAVKARKS